MKIEKSWIGPEQYMYRKLKTSSHFPTVHLIGQQHGVRGGVGNGPNKSGLVTIEGGSRKETHRNIHWSTIKPTSAGLLME